jgi:hypothetical protein
MSDQEVNASTVRPLTPRQDRLEAAIERVLRAGGTRSELRELVEQFADLARVQGMPSERAISVLKGVASRALANAAIPIAPPVGDSPTDRLAMIVRWCAARYYRAD